MLSREVESKHCQTSMITLKQFNSQFPSESDHLVEELVDVSENLMSSGEEESEVMDDRTDLNEQEDEAERKKKINNMSTKLPFSANG